MAVVHRQAPPPLPRALAPHALSLARLEHRSDAPREAPLGEVRAQEDEGETEGEREDPGDEGGAAVQRYELGEGVGLLGDDCGAVGREGREGKEGGGRRGVRVLGRRGRRRWGGGDAPPKMPTRVAPPAIRTDPTPSCTVKLSPRMRRAKRAFHRSETAPRGPRTTMGRAPIWKRVPVVKGELVSSVWCGGGARETKRERTKDV